MTGKVNYLTLLRNIFKQVGCADEIILVEIDERVVHYYERNIAVVKQFGKSHAEAQ